MAKKFSAKRQPGGNMRPSAETVAVLRTDPLAFFRSVRVRVSEGVRCSGQRDALDPAGRRTAPYYAGSS